MFLRRAAHASAALRPLQHSRLLDTCRRTLHPLPARLLHTSVRLADESSSIELHLQAAAAAAAAPPPMAEPGGSAEWLLPEVSDTHSIGEVLRNTYMETSNLVQASIEALIANGAELQAEQLFAKQRAEGNVELVTYNNMIRAYAAKGNGLKVHVLINWLKSDGLQPNVVTYASLALVFAQRKQYERLKTMLAEMSKCSLPEDLLLTHGLLNPEQQQLVLNTIRFFKPTFGAHHAKAVDPSAEVTPNVGKLIDQWKRETKIAVPVDFVLSKSQEALVGRAKSKTNVGSSKVILLSPFVAPLTKLLDDLKNKVSPEEHILIMFSCLAPSELAQIALAQLESFLFNNEYGVRVGLLTGEIGRAACKHHFVKKNSQCGIPKEHLDLYEEYVHQVSSSPKSPSEIWTSLLSGFRAKHGFAASDNFVSSIWPANVLYRIGGTLVDSILQSARLSYFVPDSKDMAFYHSYDFEGERRIGIIRGHNLLTATLLASSNPERARDEKGFVTVSRAFDALCLPMTTVPLPWASLNHGPYLISPVNIMRCGEDAFQHHTLLSHARGSLRNVFDAMDYLSTCPWQINQRLLDVAIKLFYEEEEHDDLSIPPFKIPMPDKPLDHDTNQTSKRAFLRQMKAYRRHRIENSGLRIDLSYKLMLANHFRNETIYFPHNMDFRGRAYVVPPHLHHLGNDLSRGLIMFAEKKELGADGLRWLKIHLANVYGKDKISFEDRVKFAESSWEDIVDTAKNPLGPPRESDKPKWWRAGDSPWQILATCLELVAAMEQPDPTKFQSSLPIQMDGTCNGLQHYAALGGDEEGARHVNLVPVPGDDKPQDLYGAVAAKILKLVTHHAAQGVDEAFEKDPAKAERYRNLASTLLSTNSITRKVVKQTVMTNVYGVTFVGGRDQIMRQLKNLANIPENQIFDAANYLTVCVFRSLGEMFSAADKIQHWFGDCARTIALSGEPVTWLTPLNLPIVQPYHKNQKRMLTLPFQQLVLESSSNPCTLPNPAKQRSAFPPNYVHSLDSTHMMYTANKCREQGVRFVSVHDSFWTHACTVDAMGAICRQEFVRLHSQPLLENLYQFFKLHYDGRPYQDPKHPGTTNLRSVCIQPPPQRGNFDVRNVLKSKYFFH